MIRKGIVLKIGIDFGSTYSTVSVYNRELDQPQSLALAEGESASIPSIVSISKKGMLSCGNAAKNQIGKKTVQIFEAFKMLLNEPDPAKLATRNYTDENTPRKITSIYLTYLMNGVVNRYGNGTIDEVVICVPEVWCRNIHTIDARSTLKEILQEILLNNNFGNANTPIRVVTEPEAASAFFAFNYEKETHKPFNGHLLLIDYGGGTLDITLTDVKSNGKGNMEIRYCESGGAGENHIDNSKGYAIGSGGIAFMQRVVTIALRDAGILQKNENPDYMDPSFQAAVLELEYQLKSPDRMKDIADFYDGCGTDYSDLASLTEQDLSSMEEEERLIWEFIVLEYQDYELSVNYQHLFRAYQDTIEQVLKSEVDKINPKVREHIGYDPCSPSASVKDDFRIAIVGGFGSFYLVRKQLAEIYRLNTDSAADRRTKNINADKQVHAISMGASLLAANRVTQRQTARYAIGLYAYGRDGRMRPHYAIRYHQDLETGVAYYVRIDDKQDDTIGNRKKFTQPWKMQFIIGDTEDPNHGIPMVLKPSLQKRLRSELTNDLSLNFCGFSVDDSNIVTFHVIPVKSPMNEKRILLNSFENMFVPSESEEV